MCRLHAHWPTGLASLIGTVLEELMNRRVGDSRSWLAMRLRREFGATIGPHKGAGLCYRHVHAYRRLLGN